MTSSCNNSEENAVVIVISVTISAEAVILPHFLECWVFDMFSVTPIEYKCSPGYLQQMGFEGVGAFKKRTCL